MNLTAEKQEITKKIRRLKSPENVLKLNNDAQKAIDIEQFDPEDASNYDTYEQWNNYLISIYGNSNEYLPEWGMTELDLRKTIWNAEQDFKNEKFITMDEFIKDLNEWKTQIEAGK